VASIQSNFSLLPPADRRRILRNVLNDLAISISGVVPADYQNLSEDQLKELLSSMAEQLTPFYLNAIMPNIGELEGLRDNSFDKHDISITFARLYQVFSSVIANDTNSDANNPNSSFNQHVPPHTGAVLGAASALPWLIGASLHLKQMRARRARNNIKYQVARAAEKNVTESDIIDAYQDLLDRNKVTYRIKDEEQALYAQVEQMVGISKTANNISIASNNKWIAPFQQAWGFLGRSALVFWPTWMLAVLIVGIGASYALPALPIIVGVTIVTALAIEGCLYLARRQAKIKATAISGTRLDKDIRELENPDQVEDNKLGTKHIHKRSGSEHARELARMRDELKTREHMKREHKVFKSIFSNFLPKKMPKRHHDEAQSPFIAAAAKKDRVIVLLERSHIQKGFVQTKFDDELDESAASADLKKVKDSALANYLLGSKTSRNWAIAVNVINSLIGQYTLASFIMWLVGSAMLAVAVLPFTPVFLAVAAGGVGSLALGMIFPAVGTALSAVIGGLFSLGVFSRMKTEQLNFEKSVYLALAQPAKPGSDETKQEAFDRLYVVVKKQKNDIKTRLKQQQERLSKQPQDKLSDVEKHILGLDLDNIDAFNDRYFRAQEHYVPTWTSVKKGFSRAYRTIATAQTGIFVARSLFLAGTVFAGVCLIAGPWAGVAFIAIAIACAVTAVGFRLAQTYYFDKKASERKFFLETIDARTSYLKKMSFELDAVENYLNNNSSSTAYATSSFAGAGTKIKSRRPESSLTEFDSLLSTNNYDENNNNYVPPRRSRKGGNMLSDGFRRRKHKHGGADAIPLSSVVRNSSAQFDPSDRAAAAAARVLAASQGQTPQHPTAARTDKQHTN
jgi:hypothetical protein